MSVEAPDQITPENIGEFSAEEIEAYNEQKEKELSERADGRVRELSAEQEAALEALTEEPPDTETVDLGIGEDGTEVKTFVNEDIEDKLTFIAENSGNLPLIRGSLCEVMEWFIEDDTYADADIWREFTRVRGLGELKQKFYIAARPYLERANDDEVVRKFRQNR